jgi:arylformamidase
MARLDVLQLELGPKMESEMPDAWLESEYNNRAKVPEHGAIMAGWQRDAASFRVVHGQADIALKYGPSARQVLDIFWPGTSRDVPLAMFIHGGYWQALDKDWFSHLATGFLGYGIALALPSYDLCPQVSLEVLTEQLREAAAFLIERHGQNIYATGHSAGAHLAAMLMATDFRASGIPGKVYGGYAISGLFDLEPLTHTSINTALKLDTARARTLSPLHLPAPAGKLRAFVGALEGEEYASQSRRIAEAWDGTWGLIPGANHFTAIAPLTAPDSDMMKTIAADVFAR